MKKTLESKIMGINVIENFCIGYEHAPINAAFLKNSCSNARYNKIEFYAESSHIAAVKEILPDSVKSKIVFFPITNHRNSNFLKKVFLDLRYFRSMFKSGHKNVFITTLSNTNLIALKLLLLLYKNVNIEIVPHAILNTINSPIQSTFLKQVKRLLFFPLSFRWWFFHFNSKNLNYIILGEPIAKNLFLINEQISSYCRVIDHPYIYTADLSLNTFDPQKIKIGFLGIGTVEKGIDKFVEIIQKMNPEETKIEFHLIGKLHSALTCPDTLKMPSNQQGFISKEEMDALANEMDFFIFLLDDQDYRLRASGTFFDAVNYNRPIISLSNSFIDHYLKQMDLEELIFPNIEEIIIYLKSLHSMSPQQYDILKLQFGNLKRLLQEKSANGVKDTVVKAINAF